MKNFTETIVKDGKKLSFDMIHVEGGTFDMGSNTNTQWEKPVHQVNIKSFFIGKFPVTQELYEFIMGENPSYFKRDKNPVEQVSWNDTQSFIKELNRQTVKKYRLPTESEWEYAARGGIYWNDEFEFSGSPTIEEVAWYRDNSHWETKEVGLLKPNQLGIHDMSGNVWEWCEDQWHRNYKDLPFDDGRAWVNKEDDALRVMRGGSWNDNSEDCRVAYRNLFHPSGRRIDLGFRLVLSQ